MHSAVHSLLHTTAALQAQALSPRERLEALRDMPTVGRWWLLWAALMGGCVIALVVAMGVSHYKTERQKRKWRPFRQLCDQFGLSPEEKDALKLLCMLAELKKPEVIFTTEPVYQSAVTMLQHDRRFLSRPYRQQREMLRICELTGEKLGFGLSMETTAESDMIAREIPTGAKLSVIRRGQGGDFDAEVEAADAADLFVRPTGPVTCTPGESLLVRYSREGKVWEFDATVSDYSDGRIRLGHMERARYINRRRFRWVPIERSALVAVYPFAATGELSPPDFGPCRITEIAGCGLRICGPVPVGVGDRVLAQLEMEPGSIIQGFGRVRRVHSASDDEAEFAIEMVGLSEPEVEELVRFTSIAEREATAADRNRALHEAAATA